MFSALTAPDCLTQADNLSQNPNPTQEMIDDRTRQYQSRRSQLPLQVRSPGASSHKRRHRRKGKEQKEPKPNLLAT